MMIRKRTLKALFLVCIALLIFSVVSTTIEAQKLYTLENMITNGDYSDNTNPSTMPADWWVYQSTYSPYSEGLRVNRNINYSRFGIYQSASNVENEHILYFSFEYLESDSLIGTIYFGYTTTSGSSMPQAWHETYTGAIGKTSGLWTVPSTGSYSYFKITLNGLVIGGDPAYLEVGKIIIVDLTASFGSGFEPSLEDFENDFLPSDFFNLYTSLEPESSVQLYSTDYENLGDDLTGLNYSKSIIDVYGDNVDVDIFAYVYDSDVSAEYNAEWYINHNHPSMLYLGETYILSWEQSDYSQYVIHLVLSDDESEILRKILFDRYINQEDEWFRFKVEATDTSYTKIWFQLSTSFRLNVDIESMLVSTWTDTDNEFNIVHHTWYKFYDKYGRLILPALRFNSEESTFNTRLYNDFGTQYTDISEFAIEIKYTSPDEFDPYTFETHYFYELGIFSSSDVIFTHTQDTDIDSLWDNQVCNWYDLPCQAGNAVNRMFTDIYNAMNFGAIVALFTNIFSYIALVVNLLPSGAQIAIVAILLTGLGTAVILIIVDRL